MALVDLGLPADPGGQRPRDGVTGLLLAAAPRLAVVGLCEAGDDDLVAEAMRAGARGCVDLGATGPQLAQAVVAAGRGQAILSDVVLGQLHRGMRTEDLTEREREVRELMEQGLPDRVIAAAAGAVGQDGGEARRRGAAQDRRAEPDRAGRAGRPVPAAGVGEALPASGGFHRSGMGGGRVRFALVRERGSSACPSSR